MGAYPASGDSERFNASSDPVEVAHAVPMLDDSIDSVVPAVEGEPASVVPAVVDEPAIQVESVIEEHGRPRPNKIPQPRDPAELIVACRALSERPVAYAELTR